MDRLDWVISIIFAVIGLERPKVDINSHRSAKRGPRVQTRACFKSSTYLFRPSFCTSKNVLLHLLLAVRGHAAGLSDQIDFLHP